MRHVPLLRAKLTPPRLHHPVLARPALFARLREALDHRLTLVQAGPGYGKTTALVSLGADVPLFWYTLTEADAEPHSFLSHLIAAFRMQLPNLSELPQALLQEHSGEHAATAWTAPLDALLNALDETLQQPALLVLDDYHFVAGSPAVQALVERLVAYLPPDLHLVLASRYPLAGDAWLRWRARGEVLELTREHLAFSPPEIAALFRDTYAIAITPEDVEVLSEKTEGWPIALQLVRQGLRSGAARSLTELLAQGPTPLAALFDYLATDVLDQQPAPLATFLRETAVLRELTVEACNAVRATADSATLLAQLHDLDLFVVASGDGQYRYHHLFHDFLRQRAGTPEAVRERHRRAARFFAATHNDEDAIYHWLAAEAFVEAAELIDRAGEAMLRAGRLDTVMQWIDALPPEQLAAHPRVQAYVGDVYRLRSRFDEALLWYQQAEHLWRARGDQTGVSRALRGQALVYLDQVRPAQAEHLLQEALRLTDGLDDRQARARLLELLAENKLNMGKPAEAEALRAEAQTLRDEGPGEDMLSVRVKLRTGRLEEARAILTSWIDDERALLQSGQAHSPRGHRETVLILSLICAFEGNVERASALAQEGVALGEHLMSPFTTAVAHIRLGHAWQLHPTDDAHHTASARDAAIRCYQASIALGDQLAVRRLRAEALWGLTRAYGFFGNLEMAERAACEGTEISLWAGDLWVAALTELTLGASYVLAGRADDAVEPLLRVLASFRDCGDHFGRAATRLWLSLAYHHLRQPEHAATHLRELLALCETHRYDYLLTKRTLLNPPDPRSLVPLLVMARARGLHADYAARLLAAVGLPGIQAHPGYALRVQTLGGFRVWRGAHEIEARDWQRDKARQLFQLLLTRRDRWSQRDELVETLWPQLAPEAAARDFKVALNALNKALEPNRAPDAPFAFVVRDGSAYRLRPEADLWLDCDAFERACVQGTQALDSSQDAHGTELLREAVQRYAGAYLPDALYDDWAAQERERLLALYLRAADRLAAALFKRGDDEAVIDVCQRILAHDPCWERAYRLLMLTHARRGNRPLALRAYQRCAAALHEQLGVPPSPATERLYRRIHTAQIAEPVTGA